ncbi:MAG: magnesium-translocating P-type ATPase, partial [Alphaproteobacteria bacterium]|nr:magnesium-translocating P-type ATPase [Alphaproteobacteria bacterium]
GAMDVLCTDKTGTLTQDKIILERHLDIYGNEDTQVLKYAYLNSFYQTGLRNLLDKAVIQYGEENKLHESADSYKKIDEIPFDFVRRRMSVIVRAEDGRNLLICKGAAEEISAVCSQVDENGIAPGGLVPFSNVLHDRVKKIVQDLNEDGLRVLGVSYKWLPGEDRTYTINDEKDMVLAGYIAFLDPPKESARTAIAALQQHGVTVKVVTGDNEIVTQKICKEVGLSIENVLLGNNVEAMSDAELAEVAERTTIFAKMSPLQKSRVIRAIQSRGHTVGYLGDGINDAASLRDADVGISVDTAVDIAKESADIILLEKSLMVLEEGVLEGRRTFGNIIKYVNMTASSNFGNVFSVLIASAFLPFLPMMAIQLLIQNLLYDISQISIPWDTVDKEYLEKPRKWEAGNIARFMIFLGPTSSVFDITTFCLMWFIFGANRPEMQSLFQSGWFIEGLLSQTLIVHMIRTQKIPFFQSMPATPVLLLTLAIMGIGIVLPFLPWGAHVGLVPLPVSYFSYLALTLFGYCTLTQLVKFWYIRRFGQWL